MQDSYVNFWTFELVTYEHAWTDTLRKTFHVLQVLLGLGIMDLDTPNCPRSGALSYVDPQTSHEPA